MTRVEIRGRFDLDRATYDALVEHARSEFPYEVCGLLAGRGGAVLRHYRVPNAERSMTSYSMEPKAMLEAFNDMDDHDFELMAIYHSHTHTEAFPSPTDVDLAFYPEAVYLIVSLQEEPPVVRAFDIAYRHLSERELFVAGQRVPAGSR